MLPADTEMGGLNRAFRTTLWGDILAAADPTNPVAREHLDRLLHAYWKPVYAYVRSVWNTSAEDAKDLTQAFFTRFLEKEYWSRLTPERGSFRAYLKTALHHFLIDAKKHRETRKPIAAAFSLDADPAVLEGLVPASPQEPPDKTYDREWMRCLIEDSIEEMRKDLEAQGKARYYEVFKAHCGASGAFEASSDETTAPGSPTYASLAARLGLKESDVRNYLAHCRKILWERIRARIREYVETPDDVERELREVFGT